MVVAAGVTTSASNCMSPVTAMSSPAVTVPSVSTSNPASGVLWPIDPSSTSPLPAVTARAFPPFTAPPVNVTGPSPAEVSSVTSPPSCIFVAPSRGMPAPLPVATAPVSVVVPVLFTSSVSSGVFCPIVPAFTSPLPASTVKAWAPSTAPPVRSAVPLLFVYSVRSVFRSTSSASDRSMPPAPFVTRSPFRVTVPLPASTFSPASGALFPTCCRSTSPSDITFNW